jgi:hypothetical protein
MQIVLRAGILAPNSTTETTLVACRHFYNTVKAENENNPAPTKIQN